MAKMDPRPCVSRWLVHFERGVGGDTREGRTPSVFLFLYARRFPKRNHTCECTYWIKKWSKWTSTYEPINQNISNVRLNGNQNATEKRTNICYRKKKKSKYSSIQKIRRKRISSFITCTCLVLLIEFALCFYLERNWYVKYGNFETVWEEIWYDIIYRIYIRYLIFKDLFFLCICLLSNS